MRQAPFSPYFNNKKWGQHIFQTLEGIGLI